VNKPFVSSRLLEKKKALVLVRSSSGGEIRAQCLLHLGAIVLWNSSMGTQFSVLQKPRMLSATAYLWIARNCFDIQLSTQTMYPSISMFMDYWRSTMKHNTLDMMRRWKPRCNGWNKHWAHISSRHKSNIWHMARIHVQERLCRGSVCLLFHIISDICSKVINMILIRQPLSRCTTKESEFKYWYGQ
jgi:hypothetical protein